MGINDDIIIEMLTYEMFAVSVVLEN